MTALFPSCGVWGLNGALVLVLGASHVCQEIGELPKRFRAEVCQPGAVGRPEFEVQPVDDFPAAARDHRADEAAIGIHALAKYQAIAFHSVKKARHVRHSRDQAGANFVTAQSVRSCTAENSEDVVLGRGDAAGLQQLRERSLEDRGGARDADVHFLFDEVERLALLQLFVERSTHVTTICV